MKYIEITQIENKADIYAGKDCDEIGDHRWYINDTSDEYGGCFHDGSLMMDPKHFPPGTKITVEIPECPKCEMSCEVCECGKFDWEEWVRNEYC